MNMIELAQRLKSIRVERGLTLEEVASKAGLTRGWLSKVENFRVTPSLPALSSIAGILGVTMAELFSGLEDRPPLVVVTKGERKLIRRDEDVSDLLYHSLAHSRPGREMDPFVITVPKSSSRPKMAHAGEEFLFVLSGRLRLEFDDASHDLEEGDSAYFDGDHPHSIVCIGSRAAEILVVYRQNQGGQDEDTDSARGT